MKHLKWMKISAALRGAFYFANIRLVGFSLLAGFRAMRSAM